MQRHWKVLIVTAVAVFMGFLDVTIVNVAFPDIERDFGDAWLPGRLHADGGGRRDRGRLALALGRVRALDSSAVPVEAPA